MFSANSFSWRCSATELDVIVAARSRRGASRFVPTEWSVAVKAANASFFCWSSVVIAGFVEGLLEVVVGSAIFRLYYLDLYLYL